MPNLQYVRRGLWVYVYVVDDHGQRREWGRGFTRDGALRALYDYWFQQEEL